MRSDSLAGNSPPSNQETTGGGSFDPNNPTTWIDKLVECVNESGKPYNLHAMLFDGKIPKNHTMKSVWSYTPMNFRYTMEFISSGPFILLKYDQGKRSQPDYFMGLHPQVGFFISLVYPDQGKLQTRVVLVDTAKEAAVSHDIR